MVFSVPMSLDLITDPGWKEAGLPGQETSILVKE